MEDQSSMIEKRIEHYLEVARELLAAAKKDRALIALKKKKMNEQQLQNLQAWLLNVEDILNNMELRQQQNRVFTALKQGNEAFKTLQKEFTLEDVEQLKEDTAEAQAYQDEINAALSEAFTESDIEEVEAELAALEAEAVEADVAALPTVPTTKVVVPEVEVTEGDSEEPAAASTSGMAGRRPEALLAEPGGAARGVAGAGEERGVEALREAAKERGRPLVAEEPMLA